MLTIGLLGAGRIGTVHATHIACHPGSRLAAVADVNASAAEALARAHGAQVRGAQEIVADPAIDAVLIATPTDTHADLIEAATACGKAVLCEKPVDLSLVRARACLAATARSGRPVMMGFNRRFDPHFALLKAQFDAGAIGRGELLSITSFDPAPPPLPYIAVSGGLFRDMAIHDFDMACWLYGATPKTVTAIGACLVDPAIGAAGDVDTAVTTLQFEGGRMAVIRNSRRAAYGYDQRLELLGSGGLLSAGNVLENTVVRTTAEGANSAKPEHFFLQRYMRSYAAEWDAFVEASVSGRAPAVTLEAGVDALAIAEAAAESLRTGRSVAL